jgi:hypothetical protein
VFPEHRPRWVVMRIALLIEGEAIITLGAKSVRHADWMLSVLDYGKVRDVSRLGKNSDGLPIQGDLEVRMRGGQRLISGYCVMVRG